VGDAEHIIARMHRRCSHHRTQNVVYLKDASWCTSPRKVFSITTLEQEDVSPVVDKINLVDQGLDRGEYAHFMEKEIRAAHGARKLHARSVSEDGSTANFGRPQSHGERTAAD